MSSLAKNYKRRKISFNKGKGSFLYSSKGVRYLDFVQGIAVNSLGHSNPNLNKALLKQSKKVWHVSNAFEIPEGERLAKRLTKNTFADYVLFQNSGAEATEAAVKAADAAKGGQEDTPKQTRKKAPSVKTGSTKKAKKAKAKKAARKKAAPKTAAVNDAGESVLVSNEALVREALVGDASAYDTPRGPMSSVPQDVIDVGEAKPEGRKRGWWSRS